MCTNIFFSGKTRFHLPQKRAIFVGFFIEFSAPHRCLMSSLAPLESSFYTLSNGTKLDISSARGAIVQPFFFLENHKKSRKLRFFIDHPRRVQKTRPADFNIGTLPRTVQKTRPADFNIGTFNSKIHYVTTPYCVWSV